MIKTILPLLFCISMLWTCKSQQTSGSEAPKEGGKTVEVSELAAGNYCGVNEELHKLISSKEEFVDLWKKVYSTRTPQPTVPEVNFEESLVVACFMGMRNTGGYKLEVSSVNKSGTQLEVMLTYSSPGSGCMVTEALTQPFYIGKVEKGDITDASFSTKSQTVNCDE